MAAMNQESQAPSKVEPKRKALKTPISDAEPLSEIASTEEVPMAVLLKQAMEACKDANNKLAALESLLEPEDRTPPYAALQALLGDSDVALVYDVKLIVRDSVEFAVTGFSTFTDATDDSVLPETVINFHHVVNANLMRPLLAKFNAFIQPMIKSVVPIGGADTEMTSGFESSSAYAHYDPLASKGPEAGPSRNQGDFP